jgi:hypothetical protein
MLRNLPRSPRRVQENPNVVRRSLMQLDDQRCSQVLEDSSRCVQILDDIAGHVQILFGQSGLCVFWRDFVLVVLERRVTFLERLEHRSNIIFHTV